MKLKKRKKIEEVKAYYEDDKKKLEENFVKKTLGL